MKISESVLSVLEFPKIVQQVAKYCQTDAGKISSLQIIPFKSVALALEEGRKVTEAKSLLTLINEPPLDFLPNVKDSIYSSRIEGAVLSSKAIVSVYKMIQMSRLIFQFLKDNKEIAVELFDDASVLFVDKLLEKKITDILDEDGIVKDNASRELKNIRKDIDGKRDDLRKLVERLMKKYSDDALVREEYTTLRDGRMVIPIKAEHKRQIRGFIHSESSTGQTVYIEPEESLNLNNEIVSLTFAEKREIERLLKNLTAEIGKVANDLILTFDTITYFDIVFAKAKYSIELMGESPAIENSNPIRIFNARHPLLFSKLGKEKTIPLNCEIDNKRVIIITGPNAGGKTVVLKTIGLISLMVQCGMHVPVSADSNFHFFKNILVDIGDQQSIEEDLSTFSSHLLNIKNIITIADKDSLVLLDEIGTGTDPVAGSSLASAVLMILRNSESVVLATTHLGELKTLATSERGFENAAMEFNYEQLKPAYRFIQGVPGSSYAFEIAERIGFDKEFIRLANSYLKENDRSIEKLLIELEERSQKIKEKSDWLSKENSRLLELKNLYETKIGNFEKEKKEILLKTKKESSLYLSEMRRKIETVVREIREEKAAKESIKAAKEMIDNLYNDNQRQLRDLKRNVHSGDYKIGDFVKVGESETRGEILEINRSKKTATILTGSLKMQIFLDELSSAEKPKQKPSKKYYDSSSEMQYRLDIRGEKPDQILLQVQKFLDTAYSNGMDRVEILHGKGTGALKKMVKDILTDQPGIKNFYFAPVEAGGEGITIVELQ